MMEIIIENIIYDDLSYYINLAKKIKAKYLIFYLDDDTGKLFYCICFSKKEKNKMIIKLDKFFILQEVFNLQKIK